MKILVLSDLHGREDRARAVLSLHADADAVFFLGDGIRSLPYELCTRGGRLFAGVRGNCDGFSLTDTQYSFSQELFLNLGEYTVMMMHGHTHGVKSGVERAATYAAARGADLLLYGHTHIPSEEYREGVYYFNPGSLYGAAEGATCGVMTITDGGVLFSLMHID